MLCYSSMQTVKNKHSALPSSQAMRNHGYKMEQSDNSMMTDGEYDNVELVSKSGDSLLISLVQNYPHLYVKPSSNRRDTNLDDSSWREIAAILEVPASECLKRWSRLRGRYSMEKRFEEHNMRNVGSCNDGPRWPHYAELGFLAEHVIGRRPYQANKSKPKRVRPPRKIRTVAPAPPEEPSLPSSPVQLTMSSMPSPSPSPSTSVVVIPSPPVSEHSRIFGSCNRKARQSSIEESIPETSSMVINQFQNSDQQTETSEDLFCKYLAFELKKMSENEKKATKRRLMNALFPGNT